MTTAPSQQSLFDEHRSLARQAARSMFQTLHRFVHLDELEQMTLIGLWDAAGRFAPDRGCSFKSFAWRRMKGSVLDELRVQRPGSRNYPADVCSLDAILESEDKDGHPRFREVADPSDAYSALDNVATLRYVLTLLPLKERWVVESTFLLDRTLEDCAAVLGVTESRVSQIRKKALRMLRDRLEAA